MKQGNTFGDTMNKLKQICKDTEKFDRKIIGKQFLVGKYFDGQKSNKSQRQKKFTKSKIEKLLTIQEKLVNKERTYEFYQPLYQLWTCYTSDLLKHDKNQEAVYLKMLRADFHGALIKVVHSKIDSYIGLQGLIINESLKTFKIITVDNRILTLLKNEIIFQIQIQEKYYVINGNCLIYRSIDRTKVKFKNKKPQEINLQFMDGFLKEQQHV